MSKEIYIKGIGSIRITKKKGVRRMSLSVRPFRSVNVTIPYSVSYRLAENFIKEKKDWIIKSQKKVSETENKRTWFTPDTKFNTKKHELVFIKSDKTQIRITNSLISVEYFNTKKFDSQEMQNYILKGITETLRIEAKNYLPERASILAKNHGFKFNKISVRNAKTRWGSCSGINNISLNIQLMRLPDYLIDYVILHELCHTVEKNHGKNFWFLLDKISGNAKGLDKELKEYSPSMY